MTITPEQFDKLATREDHDALKKDVEEIKSDVKQILTTLDGVAKSFKDHEIEHISNIAAHDRFEERINILEKVKN
ncbi:hypothetical protein KKE19_04740 [Patescibacteria group bacterium]|nr:hypothetical protein [Patescibacteria group bacterium]MCG2695420.1 hypothetical protein [Candidatus Parcubacteria bacterium]MCG2700899.1 hypothetical protein [Candidatus Parcubacteria bacterium]